MNYLKSIIFKYYAKLVWILNGQAKDAKKALADVQRKKEEELAMRLEGKKLKAIKVEVIAARNKILDSEADYQKWLEQQGE